ncbi:MAG: siderophore-interacting protein [Acidimicrobiia bacterium]|nr:siderophore-interacting protein [Acidimicrobiia bacterium]
MTDSSRSLPIRREPPRFRQVQVVRTVELTPYLVRVTLGGHEFDGLVIDEPAASVRVLVPASETGDLVIPNWQGNEFLLPDGARPPIRTFTPRRFDPASNELDVDVVIHDGGVASDWASGAEPGGLAAVSGPGRGYTIAPDATGFLLGGDESAIPAISQLLETIPAGIPTTVHIEVRHEAARLDLPGDATVEWHLRSPETGPGDALVAAIAAEEIPEGTRVWCAGEAASVQAIRIDLFKQRGLPRSIATIRGYWKRDRAG